MLYHVDADQVAAASARALRSGETIRGEVAALLAELEALEGSWSGGAASAFAGVLAQWRGAQVQVESALEAISTGLARAAEHYESAEATASRLFAA